MEGRMILPRNSARTEEVARQHVDVMRSIRRQRAEGYNPRAHYIGTTEQGDAGVLIRMHDIAHLRTRQTRLTECIPDYLICLDIAELEQVLGWHRRRFNP